MSWTHLEDTKPKARKPLLIAARESEEVVAAWGNHGSRQAWGREVAEFFATHEIPLVCLGITGAGEPVHPLYVPADVTPSSFVYLIR